jgi:hypothetical protein
MISNLAIGLVLGLIGIGVFAILISGIRNIANGKSEFKKVSVMLVPVIVFAVTFATFGSFNQAGVATMLFMVGTMVVTILFSGTRGTFNF